MLKPAAIMKMPYGLLILGIIFFVLFTRLYRLDQPSHHYFDEVYHGFTAQIYLHNDPKAYDVYAKPPEGFAYEWTHPPLAKLIMAVSMAVLGENAVGWRFSSVVFGSLCILMAALIAEELFASRRVAVLTALFLSLDGLLLVQSRIAMNDTHFLFFSLCAIYAYLKSKKEKEVYKWLALSGVGVGLALASKWTALYVLAIIGLDHLVRWIREEKLPSLEHFLVLCFSYGVLPTLIYLLSYGHFFAMGYSWKEFVALQQQMWWYHTKLVATHAYQSRPLQWILDLRPVWMYSNSDIPSKISNIYNLGNPVIFYAGLLSVLYVVYLWIKGLKKEHGFLLLLYFGFWVPWLFSPRIMFFYHYLPSIPALCIALAVVADSLLKKKKHEFVLAVTLLALLWLVVFYPHLTGIPVSTSFDSNVYYLIPSWK